MVPVGGSVVAGFDVQFIEKISKTYPGKNCYKKPVMSMINTHIGIKLVFLSLECQANIATQLQQNGYCSS